MLAHGRNGIPVVKCVWVQSRCQRLVGVPTQDSRHPPASIDVVNSLRHTSLSRHCAHVLRAPEAAQLRGFRPGVTVEALVRRSLGNLAHSSGGPKITGGRCAAVHNRFPCSIPATHQRVFICSNRAAGCCRVRAAVWAWPLQLLHTAQHKGKLARTGRQRAVGGSWPARE